ncbi:Interferon-induced protein 44-like [Anabarilius grahami]|uniref:Interferon-induced protein 44-like n=1 Tax=Anabarilius grahami TaxID=495550 RepID=A0A3N0Y3S9_ANAGA|nr:Interferon-induced protein 44-like [Anabarilius grahami]
MLKVAGKLQMRKLSCSALKIKSLSASKLTGHYARFDEAKGPSFGQQLYLCYNNQPVVNYQKGNAFSCDAKTLYGDDTELSEFEVYKVEHSKSIVLSQRAELMEKIRNQKPLITSVSRVRILMIGPVGAGKSSFFNSINSIFMSRMTSKAMSGSAGTSLTTQFNPTAPFQPDEQKASRPASLQEKIHCVVYVIDATKISLMSDKLEEKLAAIRIAQMVLMTKVDETCPHVQNDLENIYASSYIKTKVQEVSSRLGVSVSCVLPVKNYSQELELELNCDVLLLTALQQMLRFADDYLDDVDPI